MKTKRFLQRAYLTLIFAGLSAGVLHAGAVLRLYYDGVPGNSIQSLRDSFLFPGSPTFGTVSTEFLEGVLNEGDDYGSWFRGYLEAPQTGEYVFWVASDDDAEFWLSSDHTIQGLEKAAENVGAVNERAFDEKASQQSAPITLERGEKYYFELLHKEGPGEAHVSVGWRLPDGTLERPILADRVHPLPIGGFGEIRQTAPTVLTVFVEPVFGDVFPVPSLENTTATENSTVTFRVTVEATQPASFQWFRNGTPIEGEILSTLTLENVSGADDGATFSVEISNSLGDATAGPVTLTVQPDTEPPALVSAATRGNPNGLDVEFSEAVDSDSATNAGNYTIAPGVDVSGAELVQDNLVRLTTSAIEEGSVFTLTVNGIQDRSSAANTIASNSQIEFLQVQGVITEKEYRDIPGPLLTDLTDDENYPDNPDAITYSTDFETFPLRRDNYGVLFQGYVIPPTTGDYVFYVSSRDQSVLFLSADADPANMTEIARESQFSVPRDWETARADGANVSDPIALEAGEKYYIEARMKAAARTGLNFVDHFAVTWQMPGEAAPVNGDPPIPGDYLSSIATLGPATITGQPADQTVTELETATFSVEVDGTPPYQYRWLKNGEPIIGGNGRILVIPDASLADDGAEIMVEVGNAFSQTVSDAVSLGVNVDAEPPAIEEIIARNVSDIVNVQFSERVNVADAENTDNYSIEPGIQITNAELQDDQRTVTLTTSTLSGGIVYTLTANNIKDRAAAPNTIAADTTMTFRFLGTDRITRGLQVLYNFREGAGTAINDVSGVGTPLNLIIEEPEKVSWLQGGGLSIEEETRILSEGAATKINTAAMASGELTVEVWVQPDNVEQQGPARIVTVSNGPGGGDRNFSLNQGRFGETPDQRAKWTARGSQSSGIGDFSTPNGTATTELQHVVFTHSTVTGEARIYVDGTEVGFLAAAGNFDDWALERDLALVNEAGLVGSGRSWVGDLHLAAVYSAALTPEEIQQNYQLGPGPSRVVDGIQALYTFQEGEGAVIEDVSGVGVPLNLNIEEPEKVNWLGGGGLSINEETRILSDGAAAKINESAMASGELTVEVWVQPDNVEQQGPARIVTVSNGPGGGDRNFSLNQGRFGETPDQRAKWTARGSQSSGIGDFSTPNGTATTELQHVVFTHDTAAGQAYIYVDGIEVGSLAAAGNFDDWVAERDLALVNEAGLVGSGRSWVGDLHLVAIYNRALSFEEVTRNFEAGPGTQPPSGLPEVSVEWVNGELLLSWPASSTGFTLQQAANLAPAIDWQDSAAAVNQQGGRFEVQIAPADIEGYFRLMSQ